jgi:hypothetical protein
LLQKFLYLVSLKTALAQQFSFSAFFFNFILLRNGDGSLCDMTVCMQMSDVTDSPKANPFGTLYMPKVHE